MIFQSLIPSSPNQWLLFIYYLSLVVFLARSFLKIRKLNYFLNNDFDRLVWLFLSANLLSVIFAKNQYLALVRYRELALPFLSVYFIARNELRPLRLKTIINILFSTGTIVSFIGILEFVLNKNILYGIFFNPYYKEHISYSRVMSAMVHPAVLGTFLMCCLPCAYFLLTEAKHRKRKLLLTLCTFLILAALLLTFSRASWMVALVVTLFYFYQRNKRLLLVLLAVFVFFAFIPLIASLRPKLKEKITYSNTVDYLVNGHRLQRYSLTSKMLKDHSFFGVGPNNYRLLFDKYYGLNNVPFDIKIPENMYLMLAGESGLLGLGIFLLLIFGVTKNIIAKLKEENCPERASVLVIFSAFVGVLMNMGTYDLLYWNVPLFLFLLFLGGLSRYAQDMRYRFTPPGILISMFGLLLAWLSLGTPLLQSRYINIEACFLIILYLMATIYRFKERNFFGREDWFICVFVILLALNPFFSEEKYRAFKVYEVFVPVLLFAYLTGKNIAAKSRQTVRKIILALAGCVCVVSIIGIIEAFLKRNPIFNLIDYRFPKAYLSPDRVSSTMLNPSVLGAYLAVTLSSVFFILKDERLKKAGLFIMATGILVLFMTFSRGAWIALAVSTFIYYRKRYGRLLVVLFLALILVFLILFIFSGSRHFIIERFGLKGTAGAIFLESRIQYLPVMLRMFQEHPFLGIGMGHYKLLFNRYTREIIEYIFMVPDNMYLALIVETGALSFFAFVAFVVILLKKVFVYIKSEKDESYREEIKVFAAGLTALIVIMFTLDSLYWFPLAGLFGLYAGLSSGMVSRTDTGPRKD